MSRLLVSPDGKLWTTTDGKALLDRPFNEQVVQDGLLFHGKAEYQYLTLVDGLVSEAYDVRGNGKKMVQTNVVNRPSFSQDAIYSKGIQYLLSDTSYLDKVKTMFIVLASDSAGGWQGLSGFFYNVTASAGVNGTESGTSMNNSYGFGMFEFRTSIPFWKNLYYGINGDAEMKKPNANTVILSKSGMINNINLNLSNNFGYLGIGSHNCASQHSKIKEWGWYDRVLSENEVIYNINALNAKYKCF